MVQWEAELTELVVRRGGALVGYAYSLTRDKPQAEDLVQDALVKVYSRLRRPPRDGLTPLDLRSGESAGAEAYVRRAILTIYLDGYRRRNHWSNLKHLLADDAHSSGADRVATARVDVGTALRQLSPRQREVVTLRFFEDLTVPQIAAALGTSQGTIKRHLFDATAVLREALAEVSVPAVETDLDERLGSVTGAVRRRRTAKIGAIGGASLAAFLLAVAALWGPARLMSDPVPPATPSPDASSVAAGGGWAPTAWRQEGVQFHCGMEVTALVSSSDRVRLEITGDVAPVGGEDSEDVADERLEAPVRVTRTDADGPALGGGYPLLVFARDGQVVDIGDGWHEHGFVLPDAGASADDVADAQATTACGSWTTYDVTPQEQYLDQRPAGTYDVYAVLPWGDMSGDDGASGLAVSEPVSMEVPALEVPEELEPAVEIKHDYQPPWLEGTSLACGAHASDIPGGVPVPTERSGLRLSAAAEGLSPDEATVTFTETRGKAVDTTRTPITLVWLSNGRVVGVGSDVWSEPVENLQVDAKGETSVVVPLDLDPTCLRNRDAGTSTNSYELYALVELAPSSGSERQFVSVAVSTQDIITG